MTEAERSLHRHGILALPARLAASMLVLLIRVYRLGVSPMIGAHCRYQPTCSAYAIEALERHGLLRGTALAITRLLRCHPVKRLGGGEGFDPVPEPHDHASRTRHV